MTTDDQAKNSYVRANRDRLPPGQISAPRLVPMPPLGKGYPHIEKRDWNLHIYGEVKNERILGWKEFLELYQKEYKIDFHCVTRWSKLDQKFTGIDFAEILKIASLTKKARYVIFECHDGYTTNLSLKELRENIAFVAIKMEGKDIEDRFGGPARVVIPHLYAWKSAKFLKAIRFAQKDSPGFWETRGYHNHGNPWKEERYS